MTDTLTADPLTLRIWQQNLNRSNTAQLHLINLLASPQYANYDIILIQEPYIKFDANTVANKGWYVVYPTDPPTADNKHRALTLVKTSLHMDKWCQLEFPSTDVTVIRLTGEWGKLALFNIYNDGKHANTLSQLKLYHQQYANDLTPQNDVSTHVIWAGDFNRHHPMMCG
jgi:hypothetical protein